MEKTNLNDDNVNAFFNNVTPRFNSFKKNIERMEKESNIFFDEDVFMDTIIKCSDTFNKQDATNLDVDHYFWIAYKQNSFSNFSRNKFRDTVNLDDFGDSIFEDDDYNADVDEIIGLIKNEVKNKFGEQIYNAWILHVGYDYTYQELELCGYKGLNLHNEFRQIKRYICQKFVNENKTFKRLLKENNFIV